MVPQKFYVINMMLCYVLYMLNVCMRLHKCFLLFLSFYCSSSSMCIAKTRIFHGYNNKIIEPHESRLNLIMTSKSYSVLGNLLPLIVIIIMQNITISVIMGTMASQITSLTIVYSTVYSGADQRKHQSSAALAFVRGIHRGPVNSPHKWPVTRKMFPFDDVIMIAHMRCTYTMNDLEKSNMLFGYIYRKSVKDMVRSFDYLPYLLCNVWDFMRSICWLIQV